MMARNSNGSLASGTAIYLVANILNAAIPFALLPILTRYLSPGEYGQVAMFQTMVAALSAFVGLSVASAATRKYYDKSVTDVELNQFISACVQILLASGLVIGICIYLFRSQFSQWLGLEPKWIMIAVLVSVGSFLTSLRLGQWQVRGAAKSYGTLQVLQTLVNIILSIALVVVFSKGADGRMSAQVFSVMLFSLIALYSLYKNDLFKLFSWSAKDIRDALRYGVPLIPHVAGIFLLGAVDRFVINAQLGIEQVGIYMVAAQLSLVIVLVLEAVNKAYVPWLFERLGRNNDKENRQVVMYTYAYFVVTVSAGITAFFIAPLIVGIIAGDNFVRASDVIGWLFLGHALGGVQVLLANYMLFSKRTGILSIVSLGSGVLNLYLLLVFVNLFGIKGAALAFCLSMFFKLVLTWVAAQYCHPMPWVSVALNLKFRSGQT